MLDPGVGKSSCVRVEVAFVCDCWGRSAEGVNSPAPRANPQAFEGGPEIVRGFRHLRGGIFEAFRDGASQLAALDGVKLRKNNFLPDGRVLVPSSGGGFLLPLSGEGAFGDGVAVKDG